MAEWPEIKDSVQYPHGPTCAYWERLIRSECDCGRPPEIEGTVVNKELFDQIKAYIDERVK